MKQGTKKRLGRIEGATANWDGISFAEHLHICLLRCACVCPRVQTQGNWRVRYVFGWLSLSFYHFVWIPLLSFEMQFGLNIIFDSLPSDFGFYDHCTESKRINNVQGFVNRCHSFSTTFGRQNCFWFHGLNFVATAAVANEKSPSLQKCIPVRRDWPIDCNKFELHLRYLQFI